jgi:hypothetical protein
LREQLARELLPTFAVVSRRCLDRVRISRVVPVYIAALAGLLLTLSCKDAPPEPRAPRRERSEPAAVAPDAPKRALPVRARLERLVPAAPVPEPIDPALVPVEEDFRAEVEQRIDRRTHLESELQRIARELAKRQ